MFKERPDCKTEIIKVREPDLEPMIWVAPIALDKMALYVQGCNKEIGWLGKVQREDMAFIIHDVYLFKQQVHATTCEISPEGLSDFAMEVLTTDPENGMDIVNNLRLWGHSHVNMGVSPSGQDNTQVEGFKENNPFFVRVIANKSGEMEFAIYDFENAITYKNVKWREYRYNEHELQEQIKAEIALKVSEITYTVPKATYEYGSTYNYKTKTWSANPAPKVEQTSLPRVSVEVVPEYREEEYERLTYLYGDEYSNQVDILKEYEEMDIEEIFTNKQLKKISICVNGGEVEDLITNFGLDDDCISIEPLSILEYAQKRFKMVN